MPDLTWDELDELVDTDTLALRDRAWAEIERLRAQVGGDALATLAHVQRERDSLARRCAVRFEETQQLREEVATWKATVEELTQDLADLRASRQPQVWLTGDTVPARVWTLNPFGDVELGDIRSGQGKLVTGDLAFVEVFVPDFEASVAAEKARRAATDGEEPASPVRDSAAILGGPPPITPPPTRETAGGSVATEDGASA